MTVIFCGVNPNTRFGFMVSDDLHATLDGRPPTRCDKIHLLGNRYAVGGFGIDTVPDAVSVLALFQPGSELRGGVPYAMPDNIQDLLEVFLPLIQRRVFVQTPTMANLTDDELEQYDQHDGNLAILDCQTLELSVTEYGNVFKQQFWKTTTTTLEPGRVYHFGAKEEGTPDIHSPCPLDDDIEADPWGWARPEVAYISSMVPDYVGELGAGVTVRGERITYRSSFESPLDFAERAWPMGKPDTS